MKTANHILLTRFNLPSPGVQSLVRAQEGWLRERVELFETYCLPSVLAQTCHDFTWIVYLDPESPQWLLDRMSVHGANKILHPIYRESVSDEQLVNDIRQITSTPNQYLMTTNLDNDDAIAVDFIARLQSVEPTSAPVAIYVTQGVIRFRYALYLHRYPRNAFNTVFVDWSAATTCWSEWHTDFGNLMPVIEIDGPPGWMQVIHGSNVSNRVKGRRIPPDPYRRFYGPLLEGISAPDWRNTAQDLLIARPSRSVRESGRALAKRIIVATLGKDGIDKVQLALRARTRP